MESLIALVREKGLQRVAFALFLLSVAVVIADYKSLLPSGLAWFVPWSYLLGGTCVALFVVDGAVWGFQRIADRKGDTISALRTDNQRQAADLLRISAENEQLQTQLNVLTAKPRDLDETKTQALIFLSRWPDYASTIGVAHTLRISAQTALFHLEELERMKYIHGSYTSDGEPPEWKLLQSGRKYLVSKDLLS